MNLRQLEAFRATVRAGSVIGAAEALSITQPSVSRLIADLEKSVGFDLFVRRGRRNVATAQARRLYHAVDTMLVGIDRIRETAEAIRTGVDECAELGVIPALVEYPVPGAVANLRRANPTLSAEVKVLNTLEIADALLLQQLAVGVVSPAREYDGLAVLHEFCTPHVCLVPRDHDLARDPGPVMLATLSDEELVTFDSEFLRALGLSGRVVDRIARRSRLFSRSNPAIAALANATRSVCIVDPFTARTAVALHGTVSRPLVEELPYRVAIVVRDKVNLSIAARRLVDALEEAFVQAAGELPVCRLS